jgi:DNA transposition AAA+ family ATPase
MISFTKKGDELIVGGNKVKFPYPIYKAEEYNGLVIVLLDFENTEERLTNELYGISNQGQIAWKMENVQKILGDAWPASLVDFDIIDNKLIAFDHYARKYTIDTKDGRILNLDLGRW